LRQTKKYFEIILSLQNRAKNKWSRSIIITKLFFKKIFEKFF